MNVETSKLFFLIIIDDPYTPITSQLSSPNNLVIYIGLTKILRSTHLFLINQKNVVDS